MMIQFLNDIIYVLACNTISTGCLYDERPFAYVTFSNFVMTDAIHLLPDIVRYSPLRVVKFSKFIYNMSSVASYSILVILQRPYTAIR